MQPALQLHLRCIEATDCPRMDLRASDPYLKVRLSSANDTRKTRVCKNTLQPRWNEDFHFTVPNQANSALIIEMWDEDKMSRDDKMSRLEIHLCSLAIGVVLDQWYDMIPAKGVKKGGRLHLILHLAPEGAQAFVNTPMPQPMAGAPPGYPPPGPGYPGVAPGYPAAPPPGPGYPAGIALPPRPPGMSDKDYKKMCKKQLKAIKKQLK